jgi:hypothetical protein
LFIKPGILCSTLLPPSDKNVLSVKEFKTWIVVKIKGD